MTVSIFSLLQTYVDPNFLALCVSCPEAVPARYETGHRRRGRRGSRSEFRFRNVGTRFVVMLRLTEKIPLFWVAYAKLERLLLVRMLRHHVVSDEDDGEVGWTHACMDG